MTRRKFLKGLIPLLLVLAVDIACNDSYSERRNKKFKRTGKDRAKPGDGKGWGDEWGKE